MNNKPRLPVWKGPIDKSSSLLPRRFASASGSGQFEKVCLCSASASGSIYSRTYFTKQLAVQKYSCVVCSGPGDSAAKYRWVISYWRITPLRMSGTPQTEQLSPTILFLHDAFSVPWGRRDHDHARYFPSKGDAPVSDDYNEFQRKIFQEIEEQGLLEKSRMEEAIKLYAEALEIPHEEARKQIAEFAERVAERSK